MFLIVGFIIMYVYFEFRVYSKSGYGKETKSKYLAVRFNKGKYGEYMVYKVLSKVKGCKRIVMNPYVPSGSEWTTEIDLVMIHETGLFCVESKNYRGWIFGNEQSKYWTQTFKNGGKYKFYNPILQNAGHIRALRKYLRGIYEDRIDSVIVFGNKCELKKIKLVSKDVVLLQRMNLKKQLNKDIYNRKIVLSEKEIEKLYSLLFELSQITEAEKEAHIRRIEAFKASA